MGPLIAQVSLLRATLGPLLELAPLLHAGFSCCMHLGPTTLAILFGMLFMLRRRRIATSLLAQGMVATSLARVVLEQATLHENNIRLRFIGDTSRLEPDIRARMDEALKRTENNTAFNFTIALSYGSRQEILRAVRRLAQDVQAGRLTPETITEQHVAMALDTAELPETDLLIRTGGEQRLSNFLLWQAAYTEFYFTPVLWPDFRKEHFQAAIRDFQHRERRFGGLLDTNHSTAQHP
jgi:undecaprenyl diphosphate synthase